MIIVKMEELVGKFAENKDVAREIREKTLLPALDEGKAVTFDFEGVDGATQSFIHALMSDALRKYPENVYDDVFFKGANEEIQEIISIVYRYMQESME